MKFGGAVYSWVHSIVQQLGYLGTHYVESTRTYTPESQWKHKPDLGVPQHNRTSSAGMKPLVLKGYLAVVEDDRTDKPPSAAGQFAPVHQVLQFTDLDWALEPAHTFSQMNSQHHKQELKSDYKMDTIPTET